MQHAATLSHTEQSRQLLHPNRLVSLGSDFSTVDTGHNFSRHILTPHASKHCQGAAHAVHVRGQQLNPPLPHNTKQAQLLRRLLCYCSCRRAASKLTSLQSI
jgi:hypothetical protein